MGSKFAKYFLINLIILNILAFSLFNYPLCNSFFPLTINKNPKLKNTNIGLIIPKGEKFEVIRKPYLNFKIYQENIKFSWDNDIRGRRFKPNEIPNNYNPEKLKDLEGVRKYSFIMKCKNCKKNFTVRMVGCYTSYIRCLRCGQKL